MIPKYTIEYGTGIRLLPEIARYSTDDPVASTEFVRELLDRGLPLHAIKHEGVELPRHEFDLVVKNAASELAAKHICTSLGIKPEEEKFRFGFSA